jgi:hypothetical protein
MHAAIIRHAYRAPWALCLTLGDAIGLPLKWADILEPMGLDPDPEKHVVHNIVEGREWWAKVGSKAKVPDVRPLLAAFPLPIKNKQAWDIAQGLLGRDEF